MMGDYYYGHMFGWGGGIFMLIFWVAVILIIVWAIQSVGDSGGRTRSAQDILKERYAKGEINKQEYEEKKKDLES